MLSNAIETNEPPVAARIDRPQLLVIFMCVFIVLWLAFAQLAVPPLIRQAYRGESLSIFNRFIRGQHSQPVESYLHKWNRITVRVALFGVGFWMLALGIGSRAFVRRFVPLATPGTLGATRMWVCGILLVATLLEDLSSIALLPPEVRQPKGVMGFLYALPIGFDKLVTSASGLHALQVITEIVLFLGMLGFKTRLFIPLGALCYLMFWGILRDYTFFWHQTLVPFYVLAVLSWTRCGDGWSVDRLIKIARGRAVPDAERSEQHYGWAMYTSWLVIVWPYVACGLSKIRDGGWFWWNATNMRTMLYEESLAPREYDWLLSLRLAPAPDFVFAGLGLITILLEVGFFVVLFSRLARHVLPVGMAMTHVGIFLFQKILFLDLIVLQIVFFDVRDARKAIGRWLRTRRAPLQVLYDGWCPLCQRTVRLLTGADLFERLEFVDFRSLDLGRYNRDHASSLTLADLEKEMYLVDGPRVYSGFAAYRRIALTLPALWILAPWLYLPGMVLGARAYRWVARNRLQLLSCDAHCAVEPPERSASDRASGPSLVYGVTTVAIAALTIVMLYFWYMRIEFYPLTAMQLFTSNSDSGKITYTRILAHRESGAVSPVRFEGGIAVFNRNARYGRVLGQCTEDPIDAAVCTKFLSAAAAVYNKTAAPGERITKYELQAWAWNFRDKPNDPTPGELTQRWVYDIRADARVLTPMTPATTATGGSSRE